MTSNSAAAPPRRPLSWFKRLLFSEYFVLSISLLYFLVMLPFIPNLASPGNIGNVFSNFWPLFAVAIGQTFVLIVAGIDLSQTSVMAISSVVGAALMSTGADAGLFSRSPLWGSVLTERGGLLGGSSWAVPAGVLTMLLIGALIGWLNGWAVTRLVMPAFMVTLVMQMLFSSLAIWLTKSESIINLPPAFRALGQGGLGAVTWALVITLLVAVAAHLILARTILGRWFYAVGTNVRTARVSGVPTGRVIMLAYVFSGLCAAVASVMYSARLETGRPTLGSEMLLDIIGATVIGGTSLFGGKGKVIWTAFGVLFFVLLDNTLNLLSLPFYTIMVVKGAFILAAALLDVYRTRSLGTGR